MTEMGVEYKPVPNFEGYEVSDDGTIWSYRDCHGGTTGYRHQLRPRLDKDGYPSVTLFRDGKRFTKKVAHIVLETFLGPRPDGGESCHSPDPDPLNNSIANLRWDDHQANIDDKTLMNTTAKGENHGMVKLTEVDVKEIRRRYIKGIYGYKRLGDEFGVSWNQIRLIVQRKNWKHI